MTKMMKKSWWKWLCVVLLIYTMIGGLLFPVPRLPILNETIRALHFHVPMWFGMIFLFTASMVNAIRYLRTNNLDFDLNASILAEVGMWFGVLGLLSGMVWANFTWGEPWSRDPKQNTTAISMLIYAAYFILRGSLSDQHTKGRVSGVYNVFAFAAMIPLLFILPRMEDSLHPGNGGNPGFNAYDLDNNLRKVFYAAVLGWTLLGFWMAGLRIKFERIKQKLYA